MLDAIYGRICERLEATGLGHREACRKAGLGLDSIRNMRRAIEESIPGRRGVSTRTIIALAPVLGTSVEWLLEGASGAEGEGLPFVDWSEVGGLLEPQRPHASSGRLGEQFGRWSSHCFATRTPDEAMNRVSPAGSYIVIDRQDRTLIEGRPYVGLLDGRLLFRTWAGEPERAEPCSTDPSFRSEFLGPKRRWEIIGRVRRTILDL